MLMYLCGFDSPSINEMIRERLAEEADDLKAIRERHNEPVTSYEELLEDLRAHGKL